MFIDAQTTNIRVTTDWPRPSIEEVHALGRFPAALIGDAQSRIGVMRSDIRLRTPGLRLVGTVLPVLTREGDNLAIHRALDEAREGDVLVINANSDTNRACFGGLLGEACVSRGIAGVVIDGATRDVDELLEMKLPVFASGTSPAGPFKNGPGVVGSAVACGNVVCQAGDAIIGDSDGIVVVPRDQVAELITLVQAQEAIEDGMRQRIRGLA